MLRIAEPASNKILFFRHLKTLGNDKKKKCCHSHSLLLGILCLPTMFVVELCFLSRILNTRFPIEAFGNDNVFTFVKFAPMCTNVRTSTDTSSVFFGKNYCRVEALFETKTELGVNVSTRLLQCLS